MEKVKNKKQKIVKCGHVWVGLYRQAIGMPRSSKTIVLDVSSPSKPSKAPTKILPTPMAITVEKRKAEQTQVDEAALS